MVCIIMYLLILSLRQQGIGPFTNPDNSTGQWQLRDNNNTWNKYAHLLFIDQPAGVGLSSFSAARNGYASNGTELGHDVALALAAFFTDKHPELASNPVYLFGESYAGHYVPHIATYILEHGAEPVLKGLRRQLIGLGLGDVCPGEEHTLSLPVLMRGMGYLSPEQVIQAQATASRCKSDLFRRDFHAAFKSCEALEVVKNVASGGIYDQDSRLFANYSSLGQLVNVDGATSEGRWMTLANAWLDSAATRSALHVPADLNRSVSHNQRNCTRGLWDNNDNARSTISQWPRMVSTLDVLVYNGNFDVSCNFLGTETLLAALGAWFPNQTAGDSYRAAFHARERRWFTLGSEMAGYWRHVPMSGETGDGDNGTDSGSLTHVIIQGAGHLAPRDQPERVQAMVGRWLLDHTGDTLCDEQHALCRASDVSLRALGGRCALLYNCSGHGHCTEEANCRCQEGFAGADCSHGVGLLSTTKASRFGTFEVAPQGWQYHEVSEKNGVVLQLYYNTTTLPKRELPRDDGWIKGGDGLVVYLAMPDMSWPPDPVVDDLSRSFDRAWRLDARHSAEGAPLVLPRLKHGARIGVRNNSPGYHAPVRAYTISAQGL